MSATFENNPLRLSAQWIELTPAVLDHERERWIELADQFTPLGFEAGIETAEWFRENVHRDCMPAETYVLTTQDHLLGFFAVRQTSVEMSRRSLPILEMSLIGRRDKASRSAEKMQSGFLLSSIARSRDTPQGFGQTLLEHAIGVTLNAGLDLVFVKPVNERVSRMWQEDYAFRPIDKPTPEVPDVLWFPVNALPDEKWP